MNWISSFTIKILSLTTILLLGIGFSFKPIDKALFKKQITTRILTKEKKVIGRSFNDSQTKQDWESLREYPDFVSNIVIIAEDKRFLSHHGIDFLALSNSVYSYLFTKQKRGGGSTITMQLARVVYPEIRNYPLAVRKVFEFITAIRFEIWMTKDEILEAYLNSVSLHSNLVGFPSASLQLFGKHIRFLSIEETVYLTVLIRKNFSSDAEVEFRYNQLREKIPYQIPYLKNPKTLSLEFQKESPEEGNLKWKGENQHFLNWIRNLKVLPEEEFVSTVSSELNAEVHSIVNSELDGLRRWNVSNASALVLERTGNQTDELSLVAMIGSKNFFEEGNGMVNGTLAFRDAGSTLKPLLYAYAIDKNFYTINSIFSDEKYSFPIGLGGNYLPRNADLRYWGDITLAEALGNSRNIPAVTTIQKIGVPSFYQFLLSAGFHHLKESPSFYGPGLALGTGGASLFQLSRMYGSFLLGGVLPKIRLGYIKDTPYYYGDSKRLFSEETAEEIKFVLSDSKLRQRAFGRRSYLNFPFPVSIKTGTSKDFRNSWTIGFNDRYVVAAWVGNFSGEKTMDVSGSFGAGRIVQNVFRLFMNDKFKMNYTPKFTEVRNFCKLTGKSATDKCPSIALRVRKEMITPEICNKHQNGGESTVIGVGFVYPANGQVYLYHPSHAKEKQNIPIRIREIQSLKEPKLLWNQKEEIRISSNGEASVSIQRGIQRLELFDGIQKKASVQFEVK
ncbi:transglycosylase domain-containing protein [Leptospira jelokensis]|uniref:transglycosylase domain-containing protein n=1 Tax=Leptospira jelokensis TaxID=2484931 RepID=UPI001FCA28F1|nr:transglycosylase domain-containing protein [Leptospira jelokensis]